MDSDAVIGVLRRHEHALRARGVAHLALFGSVARGAAVSTSDIDLMVELDPAAPIGVFEYAGLAQYLQEVLPAPVDLANRATLKSYVRVSAEQEAVHVF